MPAGRPKAITQKVRDAILTQMVEGKTISEICRAEDMPAASTVYLTLSRDAEFSELYARAREAQVERFAEEILEIADDGSNDWMERRNDDGEVTGEVVNHEHISRSKLRVDSRKWLMAKMAPRKYGDKVTQEHVGGNGGPLVITWAGPQPKAGNADS